MVSTLASSRISQYREGYFLFDSFKKHSCLAAFSAGRLDLGFHHNPHLKKNRSTFLGKLKMPLKGLVCVRQVHGNRIYFATKEDKGSGALDYNSAIRGYDGIVSEEKHLPLAVLTADCLSIFLLDIKHRAAAIVHSGWRGTKDAVALSALSMLRDKFSSQPKDVLCGFGPGIRACCYEVGPEFKDYFSSELVKRKGKIFLDLASANLRQILEGGVPKKNITDSAICTSCQNKDFFSYRKEGLRAGRMMSVIMLS